MAKHIQPALRLLRSLPYLAVADWEEESLVLRAIHANPGANLVALNSDGHLVGALLAGIFGGRGTISHVGMEPDYQKYGIGSIMCAQSIRWMFEQGVQAVHVLVEHDNDGARRFWHNKMKFKPNQDRVFMEMDINQVLRPDVKLSPLRDLNTELILSQFGLSRAACGSSLQAEIGPACFVKDRPGDFGGIVIGGSFGVRGYLRNLRPCNRHSFGDWESIGIALVKCSASELYKMGVHRIHAFPHTNNEQKIQLLTMAGFKAPTDLLLELREPTLIP